MNASSSPLNADPTPDEPPPATTRDPRPAPPALVREIRRGLQLARGSALSLTRLQLALKTGDRQAAMAAMDRLHAIDTEMERLVDHLPAPADDNPDDQAWNLIVRQLGDQKAALAFEKLALVSGVSGPDMVSDALDPFDASPEGSVPAAESSGGMAYSAAVPDRRPSGEIAPRAFGLVLTLALMAVIAAVAVVMTGGI